MSGVNGPEIAAVYQLLTEVARLVGELAHGQRQLVEIGTVLANKPWLVLLDEPAAGLTNVETERLIAIIKRINQSATLIVVDHDMHFVRTLDSLITVFHQGAILVEGHAKKVLMAFGSAFGAVPDNLPTDK